MAVAKEQEMIAAVQEMRAHVVEAEAEVPRAMAAARARRCDRVRLASGAPTLSASPTTFTLRTLQLRIWLAAASMAVVAASVSRA